MNRKWLAGGVVAVLAVGVGAGAVIAKQVADSDTPITGPALNQASDAALAFTGEGRVSATEVGDEESYYQVEVTLNDGSQVDVQLDESFKVVGSKHEGADHDGADDSGDD
jgi:hypothetical protein